MSFLIVFLGSGLGACARHAVNLLARGATLPYGTFFINLTGSIMMGLVAGYLAHRGDGASANLRLFLTTGLIGGYTTFSTFSLDAAVLIERDRSGAALAYILASVGLGLAGLFAGMRLMRLVTM
ncbi:protein CrcB [bacterium SCN 62-11]|nr:MAG: protein CrcB [bacterium SCN 62-11]